MVKVKGLGNALFFNGGSSQVWKEKDVCGGAQYLPLTSDTLAAPQGPGETYYSRAVHPNLPTIDVNIYIMARYNYIGMNQSAVTCSLP